jgi:signal transduction histidine kinase
VVVISVRHFAGRAIPLSGGIRARRIKITSKIERLRLRAGWERHGSVPLLRDTESTGLYSPAWLEWSIVRNLITVWRPSGQFAVALFISALFFLNLCVPHSEAAEQAGVLLTNAADVISLPAERARLKLKVRVTGVVTAADPALKGRFFVQDSTAGVFVDYTTGQRPDPGDVVEVTGVSFSGAYAPIITGPTVRKLGTAPLPLATPVPIDRLISGAEDSQRIEVSGIVRAARENGQHLIFDLKSGGYSFRVYAPLGSVVVPQTLVAAQVRVRGTAAEAHNRTLRQMIRAEIYVPIAGDFIVEKRESANPFDQPVVPLSSLAQYHRNNSLEERVHVKGVVTLQRPGESVFLMDPTAGLQVQSRQNVLLASGDSVEAVGFPNFEDYLPVLQDAVFRKTGEPAVSVTAKPASLENVQNGLHHGEFVSFKGRVIDLAVKQMRRQVTEPATTRTTLVLQSTNVLFTAEGDEPADKARLAIIPLGSTIQVSGICLTEIESDGKVKSFRVLMRTADDVTILEQPSWFTPRRLIAGVGVLCAVLIVIVGWTVALSKKNATLSLLVREREEAQAELQRAHDLLEERVKERTAQLKFQITARKETEVRSKAVLGERTRLAQELHDTLEQTLAGIALQLEAASKLFDRNLDGAIRHLELARNLMNQSQLEVRRSVWDLRCRALEQFDLPGALLRSARQMTYGTGIVVELETRGQPRPLPEVVEENVLRIGQEALTNVIKHSGASRANVELAFAPQNIALTITDDGRGFDSQAALGPQDGHFGLLGMSERAKRLGGRVQIESVPGVNTTVRVEIPVGPAQTFPAPAASEESPADELIGVEPAGSNTRGA